MKIKALVPFSNGTISMEQYEVREVADSLGNELIAAGVAVEIGGGSGGGGLVVTDTVSGTTHTLDKTWQEIHDAMLSGGAVVSFSETVVGSVNAMRYNDKNNIYEIEVNVSGGVIDTYTASSASGYPTAE